MKHKCKDYVGIWRKQNQKQRPALDPTTLEAVWRKLIHLNDKQILNALNSPESLRAAVEEKGRM